MSEFTYLALSDNQFFKQNVYFTVAIDATHELSK